MKTQTDKYKKKLPDRSKCMVVLAKYQNYTTV